MKRNIILMGMIGIASLTLITGCGCDKKDKDTEKNEIGKNEIIENKNEEVIKDQKLEVFEFTNTSVLYEKAISRSTLQTLVKNTSNEDQTLEKFAIKVYKDKELIIELTGSVDGIVKAGESKTITSYCGEDLSSATKIEYSIVK